MDLAPEQRIRRDLILVRSIGEGGMATVWVADDLTRGHAVAVKILRAELTSNADIVQRFTSEAMAMARTQSPFVPKVFEEGVLSNGTPFIVLELMQGVDLDGYLRTYGPLSLRATARLVSQVASALEAAHRVGIVHRDVKAENIFIKGRDEDLEAKLFDFGIAKIMSGRRPTQVGALMGTPGYMSPEQLLSARAADHRADFWSLAVVAYVALTGKLPFDGETFSAMCAAVHHGVYDLPSALKPGLPVELDAWFARALHEDPEARFQTASELGASLLGLALTHAGPSVPSTALAIVRDRHELEHHSVGGVAHTGRMVHEPRRRGIVAAMAVVALAVLTLGFSMSSPRASSWLSTRATTMWSRAATLAQSVAAASEAPAPVHSADSASDSQTPNRLVAATVDEHTVSGEVPAAPAHAAPVCEPTPAPSAEASPSRAVRVERVERRESRTSHTATAGARMATEVEVATDTKALEPVPDAGAPKAAAMDNVIKARETPDPWAPNLPVGFGNSRD
jgi:eukaryotic-like serine/threonine-protein kinase